MLKIVVQAGPLPSFSFKIGTRLKTFQVDDFFKTIDISDPALSADLGEKKTLKIECITFSHLVKSLHVKNKNK